MIGAESLSVSAPWMSLEYSAAIGGLQLEAPLHRLVIVARGAFSSPAPR